MSTLLPFFSPTQVLLIDDNYETLKELKGNLNSATATYGLFDNPFTAVDYINESSKKVLSKQILQSGESLLNGNIKNLENAIYDSLRFQQVSTVIIDYDMPGLNGVELCQRIDSPHIQKIILTGAASESMAIEAFNAKLIDYFIQKNDPHVIEKLEMLIAKTQRKYFSSLTNKFSNILAYDDSLENMSVTDPVFIEFFHQLMKEKQVCEYYLLDSIGTCLFLSAEGEASALFIFNDMLLANQEDVIPEKERTDELLEELHHYRKAMCHSHFDNHPNYKISSWKDCLFPLSTLKGRDTYYWAYASSLPYLNKEGILSFKKYKQSLMKP